VTLPGPVFTRNNNPIPQSPPTDVGVLFVAGLTEKGPIDAPVAIANLDDYEALLGDRVSYGLLYDCLDAAFRIGVPLAYVGRVVGPTPVKATANIFDTAGSTAPGDVALVATAKSVGDWANSLNVTIEETSGAFVITVTDVTAGTLEISPSLASRDEAVSWSQDSDYIDITLGASNQIPRDQGPTSLAAGTDDRANITDAQWLAALNLFDADLGPGQVAAFGQTTTARHNQLMSHGFNRNRTPLLDFTDTATKATLITEATALRGDEGDDDSAVFAPWATIEGLTKGTTRTVPYSAIQAGLEARSAAAGNPANKPAAGENGICPAFVLGLSQPAWSREDREALNDAGVNVAREMLGGVRTYGYRTLADPLDDPFDLVNLANARQDMQIQAEANVVQERWQFANITSFNIAEYKSQLTALLEKFEREGALFPELDSSGNVIGPSFAVDTGPTVNTQETIADKRMRAKLSVRYAPYAELVEIELGRVPLSASVA